MDDWHALLDSDIQAFMRVHAKDDVRHLALKKAPQMHWPYALILDQIKVRQKAKTKSPDLYDTDGFIFPAADLYEQASSQACAAYKASLVDGDRFIDLTAGGGFDAFSFARRFKDGVLVECDAEAAGLLAHNCDTLGFKDRVLVEKQDAESYVKTMKWADFVYVDPQRRDGGRKGLYDFSSCSPDVIDLMPLLQGKAGQIMIKASPVLDIQKAVHQLGCVMQVYVVEWAGECKEVLYLCTPSEEIAVDDVHITAVQIDEGGRVLKSFSFRLGDEPCAPVHYAMPQAYLYEPAPAFMKAGGFRSMAAFYGLGKLHQHTHLYTSKSKIDDFCGKAYEIEDIVAPRPKALGLGCAELVLRHYPGTVAALRKKLGLKEGGDHRVFAVTLADRSKKLLICKK